MSSSTRPSRTRVRRASAARPGRGHGRTGGEILKGLEREQGGGRLKEAVESIAVTLRHRYLVGYEPEGGKRGWRKIHVDVDRPSTKVQARKGYYAEG